MNLRQLRKKIKAIANVKKITRAMELVSAVKMKKAQQEANEGKFYRETLESVIKRVISLIDPKISPLFKINKTIKELIILISSNKGLCGSFNFNLFRFCLKNINFSQSDFILLGKKGSFFVSRMGGNVIADFSLSKSITAVSAIFNLSLHRFIEGEYREVSLIYNKFISPLKNQPVKETILPVKSLSQVEENKVVALKEEYLIEPSPIYIIDPLLRNFVEEKIRGAILSSEAGEHSARMIAMKNATENANDLIYELTLLRNKLRQQQITYELLDMITAKESIK